MEALVLPVDIVGRPYAFPSDPPRTFDCWTLLLWVRSQMGLETPVDLDPGEYDPETLEGAVRRERPLWHRVTGPPADGDAVLFTAKHIGVVAGDGVLHAHAPSRGVVHTRWEVVRRRWPTAEILRP